MYIYEKKSLKMTTLQVVYNAGALYEHDGQHGTMHLMEHIICKTFDDMQSTLTKLGISWNAYTGDEQVVFHFTGLDSKLTPEIKKILVDKIIGGLDMVTEESFLNERNTVVQEYLDCFNSPESGKFLNIFRKHFGYADAIGIKEDIENFSFQDCKDAYKEFFGVPTRIIEVGPTKTDFDYVFVDGEREEKPYAKLKYKKDHKLNLECATEGDKAIVICVGKKLVSKADYPFLNIGLMMLCSGLESPFYKEIREKRGLSYYSRATVTPMVKDSVYYFNAATSTEKAQELVDVYNMLIENVETYLTQDRFDDIMSAVNIKREKRKILRYQSIGDLVRKGFTMMPKNLSKITYEKVVEVTKKYITKENIEIFS